MKKMKRSLTVIIILIGLLRVSSAQTITGFSNVWYNTNSNGPGRFWRAIIDNDHWIQDNIIYAVGNQGASDWCGIPAVEKVLIQTESIQASNITFSNIQSNQFTFNWTDGNGTKRAAFIKEGTDGTAIPINGITYIANTVFGSGTQIGNSGWYCVFNGTAHPGGITVTGLSSCKTYRVMVCEYSGSPGSESYNISTAVNNPRNVQTNGSGGIIPTDGLVVWYPFNGNANDESGHQLNAEVYRAKLTSDRFNIDSCAYNFDFEFAGWGTRNEEIYIPYDPILNVNKLTVSIWIYPREYYWPPNYNLSVLINRFQYGYSNPNGQVWGIGFGDSYFGGHLNGPDGSGEKVIQSDFPIPLNEWSQIVMTYDRSNLKLYLDGDLVKMEPYTLPMNTSGFSGISIGESNQANGFWNPTNGKIDDIGIWNRALADTEIHALYHAGEQLPLEVTSPNGGELWRVGDKNIIAWTSCGVDSITIDYSFDNGISWNNIASRVPASNEIYSWTIPNTPSEQCLVKISSLSNGSIFDESDSTFTICTETPTIQASNITFSNVTNNRFAFNWTDGNGTKRAAFIKEGSDGTAAPINGITYIANTVFGSGTQIGNSGWYCVFNGTAHPGGITVTGLSSCKTYRVMVCEYYGSPATETYNTSTSNDNPRNVLTSGSGGIIPTDGLVAWYPFNGNANDESGNGNNGILRYGMGFSSDRFGNLYSSIIGNGNSDVIIQNLNNFPLEDQSRSISIYFKLTDLSSLNSEREILCWGSNETGHRFGITFSDYNKIGFEFCLPFNRVPWNPDTSWHHLVGIYDNILNNLQIYLDTVQIMTEPPSTGINTTSCCGHIGALDGSSYSFIGKMDDIRIYNRALSEIEIQALYHEGEQLSFLVTSPKGGEQWEVGDIHDISWTSCGIENVNIDYSTDGGQTWILVANNVSGSDGSFPWLVPDTPSDLCLVRITSATDPSVEDRSDTTFSIVTEIIPAIQVISPNGNERWIVGSEQTIHWNSNAVDSVRIDYSIDAGSSWKPVVSATPSPPGAWSWNILGPPSEECLVKITNTADVSIFDISDSLFRIYIPTTFSISIPNAFTPNGDGINDDFGPLTSGIVSLNMDINDRNGRLVHTIDKVGGRWTGDMPSGDPAPQGVYFYVCKAIDYDAQQHTRDGTVSLYRELVDVRPNPVKSTANLMLNGNLSGGKTISIYSLEGILIRTWQTKEDAVFLDVPDLKPGVYIIKVADDSQDLFTKFIKL